MKGESLPIYKVFMNTKHFIIPIYQRRYSWKISQCARFYDDIADACKNGRNHFIGCFIEAIEGKNDSVIIDGQQRITTISLLLKAVHDLLDQGVVKFSSRKYAEELSDFFLEDRYEDDAIKRIKLNLLNGDSDDYFMLYSSDRQLSSDSNICTNYNYFVQRLSTFSEPLDDFYETIKNLQVIDIILEASDNPQLIFESLNSTGLALTEGDKIRNFILMGLSSADQVEYYREFWSKIEKNCGDADTSGFVRDYLSLKRQRIPNMKNVYQDFRTYWSTCGLSPVDILTDLRVYSYAYKKLLEANTGDRVTDAAITGLSNLETTVIRPFAIEVIRLEEEDVISTEEMGRSFSIIEDYIFRRLICALPSNALSKIFATLANDIKRLDGTCSDFSAKMSYVLSRKQGSGRFPDDEEFSTNLQNRKIYGSTVVWYIFSCLENRGTLETKDVWAHLEREEYSVEHIMPQTLTEEWMEDLGDDYEVIHETWVDRLANLTIVAAPYNSKFSNHRFIDKRNMVHGYHDSGLRINKMLDDKEKWGVEELEERSSALATMALSIWPDLNVSYTVDEEEDVEVSLDSDIDFTGRKLLSATFNETELQSTEWADFLEELCTIIYRDDPSRFATMVSDASRLALDSFLSSSQGPGQRKISDSVFLYTSSNTNRKIWFLQRLFRHLGIDAEDLVMHISPASKVSDDPTESKKRLWSIILPKLVEATAEAGCPSYQKRHPTASFFSDGGIGFSQMHLVSSFGFNKKFVWNYLYIDSKDLELNKRIFNCFLSHRREIEDITGPKLEWTAPDEKARRGAITMKMAVPFITDESRWNEVADISANLMKLLVSAISPYFDGVRRLLSDKDA